MMKDIIKLRSALTNCQLLLACIMCLSLPSCTQEKAGVLITVDAGKIENPITPWLYGSCIEDVNHEIYGGLYDQKIFGESFEEPASIPAFDDFSVYEGAWKQKDGEVSVEPYAGPKMVYNLAEITNGFVETEMKFDNKQGDNAGLLFYVSEPEKGADNFYGYEVSLFTDGTKFLIGKHRKNYEHIDDIAVNVDPLKWNKIKVTMDNGKFEVFLNDQSIFKHNDIDESLVKGRIALRSWNTNVRYRNLKLMGDKGEVKPSFNTTSGPPVSSQWDMIQTGDAQAVFEHDTKDAYNGNCSQTVKLVSGTGTVGLSNSSLNKWGIATKKGQQFRGRLYLKSPDIKGAVTVALQSADGKKEYARQEINNVTGQWAKYTFGLTSDTDDPKARFAVYFDQPGKLWIDQVTLMNVEKEQFKGLPFRKDIGEMMVAQKLTFLRYGGSMVNVPGYRFKKMIGDPDKRPQYAGNWYPHSTNGFGIEDFLKFSEAAGFTPSFAINIEESPEDMADMVEYLNGPATSEWGKKRAESGHPEPYNVKYIEIGNEEVLPGGDKAEGYDHYIERFILLHDAMKGKDPSLSLICAAWWRPESPNMEKVFKSLDGKAGYWDYHPWADQLTNGAEAEKELHRMKELFLKWNPNTTMKCAIFEENGNSHNIQRVLGHVTIQNAVRRMGDFVLTSCAANALQPYKQNDNGWDQGQIFFTPTQVWGMPPFYAQQMASGYHLPLRVSSVVNNDSLDITATRNEDGTQLVLHVANISGKAIATNLDIAGLENIKNAKAICLSGKLEDINTPENPEQIIPKEKQLTYKKNMVYEFEPYSYTIIVFNSK